MVKILRYNFSGQSLLGPSWDVVKLFHISDVPYIHGYTAFQNGDFKFVTLNCTFLTPGQLNAVGHCTLQQKTAFFSWQNTALKKNIILFHGFTQHLNLTN